MLTENATNALVHSWHLLNKYSVYSSLQIFYPLFCCPDIKEYSHTYDEVGNNQEIKNTEVKTGSDGVSPLAQIRAYSGPAHGALGQEIMEGKYEE